MLKPEPSSEPTLHIKFDELVNPHDLTPNPNNRNLHPSQQVQRLIEIIEYQGWRSPIIVSKQTKMIVKGHCRRLAAIKAGWAVVPIIYQDYVNPEQEYADGVSDNAIASWSNLDMQGINYDLQGLGPDFNIDHLGIDNFVLEPADKYTDKDIPSLLDTDKKCPKCGYEW